MDLSQITQSAGTGRGVEGFVGLGGERGVVQASVMSSHGGGFAVRKALRAWAPKLQRRMGARSAIEEFTRWRIGEAEGDETQIDCALAARAAFKLARSAATS